MIAFVRSRVVRGAALVAVSGLAACLEDPRLFADDDGASGGRGGESAVSGAHDGMVQIAATSLDVAGDVSPAGHDASPSAGGDKGGDGRDDKGDGKGKGKGGSPPDGGGPGPDPGGGAPTGSAPPAGSAPTRVDVPTFWIDEREVTVAAYGECVGASACVAPLALPGCTMRDGLDEHPVNCIGIDAARAYCAWKEKRLVRDREFTAAATGALHRLYAWGGEPPAASRLNACGPECASSGMYGDSDGYARTAPVGSFPAGRTPDGVDDLGGNVAEWIDDGVSGTPGAPDGPGASPAPRARGGSFEDVDPAAVTSVSARVGEGPSPAIGFRCAADR